MSDPEKKKDGCGCMGGGCLVLAIVFVVIAGLMAWSYHRFTDEMRSYSSSAAAQMPADPVTSLEYDALAKRLDAYKSLPPGSNQQLTLTGHDLNLLFSYNSDWQILKDKLHASVSDGLVHLDMSIPLSSMPLLRDRYLNGHVDFVPTVVKKVLKLKIKTIEMGGKSVPQVSLNEYGPQIESNFTNRILGDHVIGPVLTNTETLDAKDDKLELSSAK